MEGNGDEDADFVLEADLVAEADFDALFVEVAAEDLAAGTPPIVSRIHCCLLSSRA